MIRLSDELKAEFTSALGIELRRARQNRELTEPQVAAELPCEVHAKTYATYEQGIGQVTATFVSITLILRVAPGTLLRTAVERGTGSARICPAYGR